MKSLPLRLGTVEGVISKASGISLKDIRGKNKSPEYVDARMAIWFIAYKFLGYSYNAIARFYNRDHTTIIHGVKKIRRNKEVSKQIIDGINKVCPEVLHKLTPEEEKKLKNWVF